MVKTVAPQVPTVIDLALNNPSDTNTYYVSAVVQDKLSGATLLTKNLTDNGNHYFSTPWTTPQDPTGQGRELLVMLSVYTDSGYTQISTIYGSQYDTWIIQAKTSFYGGGGSYIDYDRIKQALKDGFDEAPKLELPEATDITPIRELLKQVLERLDAIQNEEKEEPPDIPNIVESALAPHRENIESMLAAHRNALQVMMAQILDSHNATRQDLGRTQGIMADDSKGNEKVHRRHLADITKILEQHHQEVLKSVEDSVADFGKQPMEVRMFMPGEIARSKRPQKEPEPKKRPLMDYLQ